MDFPEQVGTYRLVRELGRGSMGTVYLAHQESLGRDVALKIMAPEFTRDDEFVERFKREARIAARLRHPHIVQVYDASARDGHYYIAMEYLGSRTLRNWLATNGGLLPVAEAVMICEHVLLALSHAHKEGVVHRDIKPANILITDRGEAALTDFSIAHIQAASRLTRSGAMMGTPEYMSPEQFEGHAVDARADLYAVGLVLYEMLTGVHPFRGETTPEVMRAHFYRRAADPTSLNPEVNMALSAVVRKALEKEADLRFQDADEMLAALREAAGTGAAETGLQQFLASVAKGNISLDEANAARELVKAAIDEGFRKTMTVLFLDLVGSSKVKRPDETLHADRAFRDYRASINNALQSYGCESLEWAGDGVICLFEQALPAVSAAVEIHGLVAQVAERHPDLPSLKARIGINTGEVYVDPRRGLGEFASRTVDQAGHLEKDCPPGLVRVGQVTMELTAHEVVYEEVGVNRDGITVYTVVRGPQPRPAAVPRAGAMAPSVEGFRAGQDMSRLVRPASTPVMAPLREPDAGVAAGWVTPFIWEEEGTLMHRSGEEPPPPVNGARPAEEGVVAGADPAPPARPRIKPLPGGNAWENILRPAAAAAAAAAEVRRADDVETQGWGEDVEGEAVSTEAWSASQEGLPAPGAGAEAAAAEPGPMSLVIAAGAAAAGAATVAARQRDAASEWPGTWPEPVDREAPTEKIKTPPRGVASPRDLGPRFPWRVPVAVAALVLAALLIWRPSGKQAGPVPTPAGAALTQPAVTPAAAAGGETPGVAVATPGVAVAPPGVAVATPGVAVAPPAVKKPPAPRLLSVRVTTVPASATVLLADMSGQKRTGKTLTVPRQGRYKLIVRAPGYQDYRKVITVKGEHRLAVKLEKEVVVTAPAPAPAYEPASSGGYYSAPSYSGGRHEIKAPDL